MRCAPRASNGPNHLGSRYNALSAHQMARITSGCARPSGPSCSGRRLAVHTGAVPSTSGVLSEGWSGGAASRRPTAAGRGRCSPPAGKARATRTGSTARPRQMGSTRKPSLKTPLLIRLFTPGFKERLCASSRLADQYVAGLGTEQVARTLTHRLSPVCVSHCLSSLRPCLSWWCCLGTEHHVDYSPKRWP